MLKATLKILTVSLSVGSALLVATPSFALIDAQVMAGKRSGEFKVKGSDAQKLDGTEMTVAAHVDPIPLVPIAFGASFHLQTWDKDKMKVKSVEATMLNLEVMAWIPAVPVVTPYAKVGYTVVGAFHTKSDTTVSSQTVEVDSVSKVSGYNISVGVNYPVIPLIGILAEVDMGNHTAKADKVKVGGVEQSTSSSDATATTTAIRLGVQVGF